MKIIFTSNLKNGAIKRLFYGFFTAFFYFLSFSAIGQIYQYVDNNTGLPFSVDGNATGTNLTRGSGISIGGCTGANEGFGSQNWSTSTASSIATADIAGKYVSFTITPKAGYRLNITGFKASLRAGSGKPSAIRYAYNIGSAALVENGVSLSPGTSSSCSNSGLERVWTSFSTITTTESVTFKIFGFNADLTTDALQLRNIEVAGTVECNPAIVASINPASPAICVGNNITLSGSTSGGAVPSLSHLWSIVSGSSGSLSSPSTLSSNVVSGLNAGTLEVKYTASYDACVVESSPKSVEINGLPTLTFTNPESCFGATSTNLEFSGSTNSPDVYTINFDAVAETSGFSDILNTSLLASPISIPLPASLAADTYNATLVVENTGTGCQSQVYNLEVIHHELPTATDVSYLVCETTTGVGEGVFDLTTNETTITGGASGVTVTYFSDGLLANSISSPIAYMSSGGETVYAKVIDDATGCYDVADLTLNVQANPTVIATASVGGIYNEGDAIGISTVVTGNISNYAWSGPNSYSASGVGENGVSILSALSANSGTYTVTVTGAEGCTETDTARVQVFGSTIYVNGTSGDDGNSGTSASPLKTIQKAIDVALATNTIEVSAGTYAENLIVDKELTIKGPNYGISPNTGTRGVEAILMPATTETGAVIFIEADNIVINGFLLDGDNPLISSGNIGTNSADIDAYDGIGMYDPGNTNIFNNSKIENNIIQNFQYTGVDLFGWFNSNNPSASGHLINDNLFKDLGTYTSSNSFDFWGLGILIYNDIYTRITNNVMTNVRSGIQTGNFHDANPGNAMYQVIDNNTIQARRRGIFYNLHTGPNVESLTFSNNSITALANSNETQWDGILASSLRNAPGVLTNNTVDGSGAGVPSEGIEVWNVDGDAEVSINGGSLSNVDIGIFLNNYEGYSSDASSGSHANISAISITPTSGGVGIKVLDSPSSTLHANVEATIGAGVTINNGTDGIVIENASAKINTPIGNVAFSNQSGDYVKLIANTNDLNMATASFDGQTGATASLSENFAIEDKIIHKIDDNAIGFVLVKANNNFVTTNSGTIQQGIDIASPGFEVNVGSGTFTENVTVNKFVKVKGAGNTTIVQGVGNTGNLFTYTAAASGVDGTNRAALEGMKLTNAQRGVFTNVLSNYLTLKDINFDALTTYGIQINTPNTGTLSDWTIENSTFNATTGAGIQVATNSKVDKFSILNSTFINNTSGAVYAGQASSGLGAFNDVKISGCTFTSNGTANNNAAIYIEKLSNAEISTNTFTDNGIPTNPRSMVINLKYDDYENIAISDNIMNETRAATMVNGYGIQLAGRNDAPSYNSNPASVANVTISSNEITSFQNGVGIENNVDWNSTSISNNSITNANTALYGVGANAGLTLEIHNNSFTNSTTYSLANGVPGSTINADCNWFGTADPLTINSKIIGNVNIIPFTTNGTDDEPATTGFQPVAGSCDGAGPVKNIDTDETFLTIQAAIDDANTDDGDVIEVASGTYDEQVTINKEVTLNGTGTTKPIVNFTGTVVGRTTLFDIVANNVTINNFQFDVDMSKLHSAILASAAGLTKITVTDNDILPYHSVTDTYVSGYGNRNAININHGSYRISGVDVNDITVTGNKVAATVAGPFLGDGAGDIAFRAAASVDAGAGTFSNNDFQSINHDVLVRFNSNDAITIDNNMFKGGGVQLSDQNAGAGTLNVTNNTFDGSTTGSVMRLQNNQNGRTTVVSGNTFNNLRWGVSLENYKNVSFDNNIFNALAGETDFNHIVVNTKSNSSNSNTIVQTVIDGSFTNNTFNSLGSDVGTAMLFLNQDSDNAAFGTFVIGSDGNENTFNSGFTNFIKLGNQTGSSSTSTFPTYPTTGGWVTTMACWAEDLTADFNKFDVGSGAKLSDDLTEAERTTLETKVFHKPDDACLAKVDYFLPIKNVTQSTAHATIQDAIDLATAGDIIRVGTNDHTEPAQIVVDKNLTLEGLGMTNTILRPGINTGTSSDARAFILVNASVDFDLRDITINGTGKLVWQAIRQKGEGTINNVNFTEIKYNPSTNYQGTAVAAFGTGNVGVTNCTFSEIGRIGVLYFGTGINGSNFSNNTYTGKGVGDWLDYALDVSSGAIVNATNNTITNNRGVASSDGSTSAGILVSTFFGPGTTATITGNTISNNSTGVFIGFDVSDASTVAVNENDITGNDNGVFSTAAPVNATNNYWGSADGPGGTGTGSGNGVSGGVDACPFYDGPVASGSLVDCPVKVFDNDPAITGTKVSTHFSIQEAVNATTTGDGYYVTVNPGTYDEQVIVNKELTISGVGATKPKISFTGTAVGKNAIFDISADKVTINNFEMDVDLTKLSSGIVATSAELDEITITNNIINAKGSSNAVSTGSYGLRNAISINYAAYRVATGGVDNITVTDNTVTGVADDGFGVARTFRSGVSVDEGGGTYTGNDFTSINHDILIRFNSNGAVLIDDNDFRGGGVQIASHNAGGGQVDISNNTFDSPFANAYTSSLRLQYNNQGKQTNVTGNTFNNHNWGISLENYKSVTIDNNTFTPLASSTTYRHITTNTKVIAGDTPPISQTAIDATFINNTFNGSGTVGGTALAFYNHDDSNDSYGTFVVGSDGNENTFNDGIGSFITLGDETGATSVLAASYGYTGIPSTTAACWSEDLDAKFNKFDVGSGPKLPTDLSFSERTDLETKLYHKPDNVCLAEIEFYLPVKNLTQVSSYATIAEAITSANANDVIEISEGNYNERVIIDKSITLQGVAGDSSLQVIDGTGLGNGDGIQIANGVTDVSLSNLTIQNFAGSSGNADAGIYAIGSNDNLSVSNVSVKNNVGGSGIYANGPVDGISITNSLIEGQTVGARGIVIWNGFKQNITITGNTLTNNSCCGIELQDGTASAVNISNNIIDIGTGDNAIGLTSLNELTGPNLIDNNTITGGGRYGIEVKNPAGGVTVSNNNVTLTTQNADLRDRAGIAVFRRGFIVGQGYANIPNGVTVTGNTVTGYQQTSDSEGFGIVIEGTNHTVSNNTLDDNDIGIQQQAGHSPYTADAPGDGDQSNLADSYFGRGNSPELCNVTLTGNTYTSNGVDERIVIGGGTGTIVTEVTPTVDDPTDVEVCNGETIAAIAFTGNNLPGVVYNWTNDNTDIGLAVSGTGDIASFAAINSTLTPASATITVTPTVNGCDGTPQEFTITINPSPIVAAIANQTLCVGESVNTISFSGNGTTYDWVSDNDAIGLALAGTGDIASFTATNATGVPQIAYVTVTPTFTSASSTCVGESESFSIIVKDDAAAELICQDDATIDNDAGLCSAVYNFELPLAFDPQFYDGFENINWDNSSLGWTNFNAVLTRELSGTVIAPDGAAYGLVNTAGQSQTGVFSRLGGYSSTFGDGFRTKVDVYIDLADPAVVANTYGFDVSSAANGQDGLHQRDFIFHAASNASGNVLIAGSNGTNFARRNDLASINHHEITASGWYTFEWMFQDKGDGTLEVDLNLKNDAGATLFTETRNDPSDLIATEVGGNRYMWFTFIAADNLRIDNVEKANILPTTSDIASGFAFPVGSTTVTVTAAADACGNQATCTFDVTVNDVEAPIFANCPTDAVICADDATYSWNHVTLSDICTLSGGLQELTYTLSGATISAAPVSVTSYDGSTQGTETFNTGVTTVTYSGKDAAGNIVSNACSFTVTVNEVAMVEAGTYSDICNGGNVTLAGSFSGAANSITWSDGSTGGSFAPNANDPLAVYTPPANFTGTITLTITSDDPSGPCPVATATASLVVNPNPTVAITPVTPFCEGGTLNLSATVTGATTYAWSGPNGFTSAVANPTIPSATAAATGVYTLIVTSAELCTATATISITVYPLPTAPVITSDNSEICKGINAVLSASCSSVTDIFRWTTPPINQGSTTSALSSNGTQVITTPGTYTGYCESVNGCVGPNGSITIVEGTNCGSQNFITVTPEIPFICPGASIDLTAAGCTGTVTWTSGAGSQTGTTATLSPAATTTYAVSCSSGGSTSVLVRVAEPNVTVTNNISTGKAVVKAINTITSDKLIGNPAITPAPNVIYEAGNSITLNPGFAAQGNAIFKAEIKVCN